MILHRTASKDWTFKSTATEWTNSDSRWPKNRRTNWIPCCRPVIVETLIIFTSILCKLWITVTNWSLNCPTITWPNQCPIKWSVKSFRSNTTKKRKFRQSLTPTTWLVQKLAQTIATDVFFTTFRQLNAVKHTRTITITWFTTQFQTPWNWNVTVRNVQISSKYCTNQNRRHYTLTLSTWRIFRSWTVNLIIIMRSESTLSNSSSTSRTPIRTIGNDLNTIKNTNITKKNSHQSLLADTAIWPTRPRQNPATLTQLCSLLENRAKQAKNSFNGIHVIPIRRIIWDYVFNHMVPKQPWYYHQYHQYHQ